MECFSNAGADELLRAVREAAARDVRHKVGEESCEAKEREKAFGERRPLRSTVKCKAPTFCLLDFAFTLIVLGHGHSCNVKMVVVIE